MRYYASLVKALVGVYYPLPFTTDDPRELCHLAMRTSSLKGMWCEIYTEQEVDDCIAKYGGDKLPSCYASRLDYDWDEVSQLRERLKVVTHE